MKTPPAPRILLLLANSTLVECMTKTSLEKESDGGDITNESLEKNYPTVGCRRAIYIESLPPRTFQDPHPTPLIPEVSGPAKTTTNQ